MATDFTDLTGSWVWDIPADQVYADDAAAFLFGLDPDQGQTGCPVDAFEAGIHPDDREAVASLFRATVATGGVFVAEYRTCPRDGSVRRVLERGHFYHDAAGCPRRAHGIIVDITDRKLGGGGFATRQAQGDDHPADHPLERAADLCMAARQAVREANRPFLLKLVDMVLLELGRELKGLMDAERRRRLS
ncbi:MULTISPECIES: PAS domain-containing protein [Methylobacterium]|uniref:PAS domain-containing protein n=1 Tax=Methylobacterium TaxID=407 RepID=UPI0013ECD8C9|nr:PAS domain-containing protein [Methylobacterium sp. DB0501]NGM34373.1 PAS domain-containing protein [Methylobacterium sp. DB0501]